MQTWTDMLAFLRERELLPSINFMFSKKMINNTAAGLTHLDFCTAEEKGRIGAFLSRRASSPRRPAAACPEALALVL